MAATIIFRRMRSVLEEQSVSLDRSTTAAATETWEAQWRAWAARHQTLATPADDDRESIYAGRGE